MVINIIALSVQHNGGFLPGIIPLTLCYYHRGTRSNAMKRFCICSLFFFLVLFYVCFVLFCLELTLMCFFFFFSCFICLFLSRICLASEKPDKELPGIVGARGDTV